MCFLKSRLSSALRGAQIPLHPSTLRPPSFTFHQVESGAAVDPGFALQNYRAQRSFVNQAQVIYCTEAQMRRGSPARIRLQRLPPQPRNIRAEGRAPALPTKALCMVVGEQCWRGEQLWLPPYPLASPTQFSCPIPAGRRYFYRRDPFRCPAAHHCGPGCWVGAWEPSRPGARGTAWLGVQLEGM